MAPIVLIGSSGYLGARVLAALRSRAVPVVPVERDPTEVAVGVDLCRRDDVARLVELSRDATVVYCANVGGRATAEAAPTAAKAVNLEVPRLLAAVAAHVVYFSTDYVFSGDGPPATVDAEPCPIDVYSATKRDGEMAVMGGRAAGTVVRVSGLFDEGGTRALRFADLRAIEAPDNCWSTPTNVVAVADASVDLVLERRAGTYHFVGPSALTRYEFSSLASLPWGFRARPTLETNPRVRVLAPSAVWRRRQSPSATETFARLWKVGGGRPQITSHRTPICTVFDTVGGLLAPRRWKHPNPTFWQWQESIRDRGSARLLPREIEMTALAYTLNPDWPDIMRMFPPHSPLVLANNGPAATFERWVERLDLGHLFDFTLNSERDQLAKPSAGFFDLVARMAGTEFTPGRLIDDCDSVIDGARRAGWQAILTRRIEAGPIDRYSIGEEGDIS